jgi:hypothetical protein
MTGERDYEIERERAFVRIVAGLSNVCYGVGDWLDAHADEESARISAEERSRNGSPEPTRGRQRPRGATGRRMSR